MKILYGVISQRKNGISVVELLSLWIFCCCYPGDEARPHTFPTKPAVTVKYHVTFKEKFLRHVTFNCSCNCSIWYKNILEFTTWNKINRKEKFVQNLKSSEVKEILPGKNLFRIRRKRSESFSTPYRIGALGEIAPEVAVLQPFDIRLAVLDAQNEVVSNLDGELQLDIANSTPRGVSELLAGDTNIRLKKGRAEFFNITFIKTGENYKLVASYSGTFLGVGRWNSKPITVTERHLILKPSGRVPPISSRENNTLSPAAGVVIYDVLNDAPASKKWLSQYTWEGNIALLYEDVYPGQVVGTTFLVIQDGSNEILFSDLIISSWGYSYLLKITIRARETSYWDLSCLIGPFDVDMLDTFEMPLIESSEFRRVRIIFDGNYKRVEADQLKFEIFFLNFFGRKYPKVKWQNLTINEGSVAVDAVLTGLAEDLEKTADLLSEDISEGRADIQYEGEDVWRANRVYVPTRKLLEESGSTEGAEESSRGLSVAWIVAIVINVILIAIFVVAIIYCWVRRKKMKEENEDDPPGYPSPSPEPTFPTPVPSPEEDFWRPDPFPQEELEEEEEEMSLPGAISEPDPEPEKPKEDRYYIYQVTDVDGSRDLFGQLYLRNDSFLDDVRRALDGDRNVSEAMRQRDYRFLDENMDAVLSYQESSLSLERVFPSQEIYIQYLEPDPPKKPKVPAYVGPLGICNASECTRAAKVKCLDCRNVAYCSKGCRQDDLKDHRRACYKPAWRL